MVPQCYASTDVRRITSRQNPLVARYRAIGRGEVADLLLLDGVHLVSEALDAGLPVCQAAVAADARDAPEASALASRLEQAGVEVVVAPAPVMDVLSPVRSSSAIVAIAQRPAPDADRLYGRGRTLVVVATGVQDPGNLGAIVRVAEAGGASGVVATEGCADPFGWKALRGSMGSSLRLPVFAGRRASETIAEARRRGCRIVATVPRGGRALYEIDLTGPAAVLIGGEGPGLPRELVEAADDRVTIPMQAPVESLNAAITAALLVYEARRQRNNAARGSESQGRRVSPERRV